MRCRMLVVLFRYAAPIHDMSRVSVCLSTYTYVHWSTMQINGGEFTKHYV